MSSIVKVFPQETELVNMKDPLSTYGYTLSEIINNEEYTPYVEETLYTSLNNIRFYYPPKGSNVEYIKNGNHILFPTQEGYNLYTIDSISVSTDDGIIQVDAQHYSVNFMRDSAHELAVGKRIESIESINNTLSNSSYVSNDFKLTGTGYINDTSMLGDDTIVSNLTSATIGSVLVGTNSVLRKQFGQYIRRKIDSIEAFKVEDYDDTTLKYPLVLGVNVRDMDYTIDTSNIFTTAVVSGHSLPQLYVHGERLGGKLNGFGGTKIANLESLPLYHEISFIYKGIPLVATHAHEGLIIETGKLVSQTKDTDRYLKVLDGAVVTYNNGYIKIVVGANTYIDELLDPSYVYAYSYYNHEGTNVFEEYMGYARKSTKSGEHPYVKIEPHMVQVPIRANTTIKGNAVKYVDFEPAFTDEDDNIHQFYRWYFGPFKHYWTRESNKHLLEPTFEAKFTIDDMKTLYGEDIVNEQIFRIGDVYNVDASEYQVEFRSVITKTKYNALTGELIEVEFGNKQDLELEVLKTTNVNKPSKWLSTQSSYSPPISSGGGGGGDDEDEEDKEFDLDDILSPEPPGMQVEYLTDDGPERIEWQPPVLYLASESDSSTPTKMLWYNSTRPFKHPEIVTYENLEISAVLSNDWNHIRTNNYRTSVPERYLDLVAKPPFRSVEGNTYKYKGLINRHGRLIPITTSYSGNDYNGKTVSTQMTFEEWKNQDPYYVTGNETVYIKFDESGVFTHKRELRAAHDLVFNVMKDLQYTPFVRQLTAEEVTELIDFIKGKSVKELLDHVDGYTTQPINKEYVKKRFIWVIAQSARTAILVKGRNEDKEDYRTRPEKTVVITTHRYWTTTNASSQVDFGGEVRAEYNEPIKGTSGNIIGYRPREEDITIESVADFFPTATVEYAYKHPIEPHAALVILLEMKDYPDLPIDPIVVQSHGETGYEIHNNVDELEKIYRELNPQEKEEFNAYYGKYSHNLLKAKIEAMHQVYREPISDSPYYHLDALKKEHEIVNGKITRHWENVYSYAILKGKISQGQLLPEDLR